MSRGGFREAAVSEARCPHWLSRAFTGLALVIAVSATALAADKYVDPDDASMRTAAKAALSQAQVLDFAGTSLDIIGATRGVEAVLKDLGAKVTDRGIHIELAADVLFDFDKSDLRRDASPSLEKVAQVLRAHSGAPITIGGHTDGKGSDAYNQPLSERRAAAVKDWLVKNGAASAAKITVRGWGKSKPVAPNSKPDGSDDTAGRQKNRRVEINVQTS